MDDMNDKKIREYYRKSLPHGSQVIIAKKVGVTPIAVSQFLRGTTNSERIENAIIEMIAEKKEQRDVLLRKAGLLL